MNTLFLYNTKILKSQINTKIFAGDNLITKIQVKLPDNIGGYPKAECVFNLRAIIPEGNMSYIIDVDNPVFTITNDITEKAQTVKLMMIITHEGNVIGRTNTVDLQVREPAEAPDPPLTPREEFDEVIAEQRAEIAGQAETITAQSETITQQGEQITELSGEVSELESTVAEQQATITRQNTTIDELNHRVPPLQTLNPINPSQIQQTFNPESPNIGFPQVVVNTPTAEGLGFREDYYKKDKVFLGKVGTYDPFPEHSYGGIYYTELGEGGYPKKILIKDMLRSTSTIPQFFNASNDAKRELREVVFENCPNFLELTSIFQNFNYLTKVILPDSLTSISAFAFSGCSSLTEIILPDSLMSIGSYAFNYCTSLTNLTLAQGFNCNGLNVSASTLFTAETIVSWLEALADRTGETAYTLTIGTTNINKLTTEQRAIATNKNWNLA